MPVHQLCVKIFVLITILSKRVTFDNEISCAVTTFHDILLIEHLLLCSKVYQFCFFESDGNRLAFPVQVLDPIYGFQK